MMLGIMLVSILPRLWSKYPIWSPVAASNIWMLTPPQTMVLCVDRGNMDPDLYIRTPEQVPPLLGDRHSA